MSKFTCRVDSTVKPFQLGDIVKDVDTGEYCFLSYNTIVSLERPNYSWSYLNMHCGEIWKTGTVQDWLNDNYIRVPSGSTVTLTQE